MDAVSTRQATLILDANLLLLLAVGSVDRKLIRSFQRTQSFEEADFDSLVEFVRRAPQVVTTPHVLTEVSILANTLTGKMKEEFFHRFRIIIVQLHEQYQDASSIAGSESFRLFWLTDSALLGLEAQALLLSEDGRFATYANSRGVLALNLRTAGALRKRLHG